MKVKPEDANTALQPMPSIQASHNPILVDTHSHLDVASFAMDRDAVVQRARQAGVAAQIVPAIDCAGWPRLRAACDMYQGLYPAYGLHPIYLAHHRPAHLQLLRAWLETEPAVAIGECGLDYFIEDLDRDAQRVYFDAQLQLAREFQLPVIVHARRAVDAVIASLRRHVPLRGVVHSFSGSQEQASQLYKLGFLLGIGGPVTYARAKRLRALVASMPLSHLLLETDSPDQPASTQRGQRNEPARLRDVFDAIVALRSEPAEQIAQATTANARDLFGLPM